MWTASLNLGCIPPSGCVPNGPLVFSYMLQAISSLLCFRKELCNEEAYIASFQRSQQVNDMLKLSFGVIGNLLLMLRLLLNGSWLSAGAAMTEVAVLGTYRWLSCSAPAWFLWHRSLIIGSVFPLHAVVRGCA